MLFNVFQEVMNMLQEFRDVPGISDQVDYLMNSCQVGYILI